MTQQENAQELIEAYEMLGDDFYTFILDLGKKLPPLPEDAKIDDNLVKGCQSKVWMISHVREEGGEKKIDILAESDSIMTKGLIVIVSRLYSGQTPRDILQFDIEGFLKQINLDSQFSMGRRNGLAGMVTRVKTLATELESSASA